MILWDEQKRCISLDSEVWFYFPILLLACHYPRNQHYNSVLYIPYPCVKKKDWRHWSGLGKQGEGFRIKKNMAREIQSVKDPGLYCWQWKVDAKHWKADQSDQWYQLAFFLIEWKVEKRDWDRVNKRYTRWHRSIDINVYIFMERNGVKYCRSSRNNT